jgi:potassium efflux system protein
MKRIFKLTALLIIFSIAFFSVNGFSQTKKRKPRSERESERRLKRSRDSILQTFSKTDTSVNSVLQRIEQYTTTFNQVNNNLSEGLDTTDISEHLPGIVKRLGKIQVQTNTKKPSTLRYLFVLRDNLDHIKDELDDWQASLVDIDSTLIQNQHDIVRFTCDSLLKTAPADSLLKSTFFLQRKKVWLLWHKTDALNRNDLLKLNLLQDKVAVAYTKILDETDQIDSKIKKFADVALSGEFDNIWKIDPRYNSLDSALTGTVDLNNIQLYYFIKNGTSTHLIGLLFLVLAATWIFYNWKKAPQESERVEIILNHTNYIYNKPVISSLLLATTIVPYFYSYAPVAFLEMFFLVSIILTLLLIRKHFPKSLFNFLHQLFWLTIIYSLSNLLIQITNIDRFVILLLSIVAICIALLFHKRAKAAPDGQLPYTRPVLSIFIAMQFLSILLNVTGRFSLAKIVAITAVFNLWMLVGLYFVVQIIIQGLFLQFHTKKDENSLAGVIDYDIIQKKFLNVLYILAGLLWAIFLLQNLNIDDWVHDYLADVLNQSRTIGGASFTFGGFVVFIMVLWLSSLASKIISYFYDISAQKASDLSALKKKNRASTLLIRMAVFSIGFFLAVAASGFPLDKLTIIFSAFGVGIGFGLQNIVNNLVSGLILAFEKPVQIGDIIEVDGRSGTIREIGIRASKIATADGAEVIIPNGDLISHHLINWTLSNNNRRVELIISTAYGSDIQKVIGLLKDLLNGRDDIMDKPGPSVFLHNLTDSSVDFRIFFWAADLSDFLELKSRVLAAIYEAFRKEGIEGPSGDKDINVHFPDELPVININSGVKENNDPNKNPSGPVQ